MCIANEANESDISPIKINAYLPLALRRHHIIYICVINGLVVVQEYGSKPSVLDTEP